MPVGTLTARCPVCRAPLREDRLARHVTQVHPRDAASPRVRKILDHPPIKARTRSRRPEVRAGWPRWPIYLGVLAVLLILAFYVLTRPGPAGSPQVGSPAPDISFTTLNGTSLELSGLKGHPLVLWFVATWCPGCSDGTILFTQQYYSQYHAAGVLLVELESYNNLGEPGPSMASFASSAGYQGQPGWIVGTAGSSATSLYNPNQDLDIYYAINAQGIVTATGQGLGGAFSTALAAAQ
jgi:thiol-disulfide isomerase/thioredoxin